MRSALCACALGLCVLLGAPGCATNSAPPTHAAIVFYSFKDCWTAAFAAYSGYAELAVQGKVSARDQRDIDAAWNQFRAAFKTAFHVASSDWSAATPDQVQLLANEVLTLIRALP